MVRGLIYLLGILSGYFCQAAIYGRDDRREIYQLPSHSLEHRYSESIAMLVPFSKVEAVAAGYVLNFQTLSQESLAVEERLCRHERFANQPASIYRVGTGFLVAPDVLITAGHVIHDQQSCDERAVFFGVKLDKSSTKLKPVPMERAFRCKKLLHHVLQENPLIDYSIIQLDRPVEGIVPLPLRTTGRIRSGAEVFMLGHPMGLPQKISSGGVMMDNSHSTFFSSYLDTYPGNSGSPVIDPFTGWVEGVLVEGESGDTTIRGDWPEGCWSSKIYCLPHLKQGQRCDSFELRGAKIIRSTVFSRYVTETLRRAN